MRDQFDRELERRLQLDDAAGPAQPIDDARSAALIAGALGGAGFPPPAGTTGSSGGTHGVHGASRVVAGGAAKGVAAAKLAIVAGGAVAVTLAGWVALRSPEAPPLPRAPIASSGAAALASAPMPAPAPVDPPSVPVADPPAAAEAATTPEPPSAPAAPVHRPFERVPGHRPRPAHAPSVAKAGSRPHTHAAVAEPPASAAAPEDLLAAANAARAAHHWRDADALYSRVIAEAHGDLAAQTALVASASLHLEHLGDPVGAESRFRAALAADPRDALAEDARWGLAESARALDDAARERRALDEFLAHHPGSARAPRARERRAALGAGP